MTRARRTGNCGAAKSRLAWIACALAIFLGNAGCGGSRQTGSKEDIEQVKQARRQQQEKDEKEQKTRLAEQQSAKQRKEADAAKKRQETLARHTQRAPSRRKRPDDVRAWRKRDFHEARLQSDRKLVPAVEYLGNALVGDVHAARLLGELLLPQSLPHGASLSPGSTPPRVARGTDATDAIVRALVLNDTPLARTTLEQTALSPPVDRAGEDVARCVLQRLAEAPTARSESLLLQALKQPHAEAPMATDRADDWQQQRGRLAEAAFAHGASAAFRAALADCANQPTTPPTLRARYAGLLEQPMPENLRAQIVLFQGAATSEESRIRLETQWAAYGSEAVQRMLGGPAPPTAAAGRGRAGAAAQARQAASADPQVVSLVGEHLWTKPATTLVENRLYRADSLKQYASTILVAATIPKDSTRSRLHDALRRNWVEGPQPLRDAGLIDAVMWEPGFWLVLKSCRFAAAGSDGAKRSARAKSPEKTTSAENDPWHATTGEMLLTTLSRLEEAAASRQLAAVRESRDPTTQSLPADFPLLPHDQARPVAELHLTWPEDTKNVASSLGPDRTKLWYARFHETAVPDRIATHYRRQMKSTRVHAGPKGCWLECVESVAETGVARSIDVVIQTTSSTLSPRTNASEPLTIQVLVVEAQAPTLGAERTP